MPQPKIRAYPLAPGIRGGQLRAAAWLGRVPGWRALRSQVPAPA
jgi:hypothetical protein